MTPEITHLYIEANVQAQTLSLTDGELFVEKELKSRDWDVFMTLALGGVEGASWEEIEATAMKHDRWVDYPGNNAIKRLRKLLTLSDPQEQVISKTGSGLNTRYILNGGVFISDTDGEVDLEEPDNTAVESSPTHPLALSDLEFALVSTLLRNNYGETFTFGKISTQFIPPYDLLEIGANLISNFKIQNPDFLMENDDYAQFRVATIQKLYEITKSEDMDDLIDAEYSKNNDNGELLLWLCLEGEDFMKVLASKYSPELIPELTTEPEIVVEKVVTQPKKHPIKSIAERHPTPENIVAKYLDELEEQNFDKALSLFQLPKLIDPALGLDRVAVFQEKQYVRPEHRKGDKHPEFGPVDIVVMRYLVDYGNNLNPRQVGELRSIARRQVRARKILPNVSKIMHLL